MGDFHIRPLQTLEEFQACVAFQEAVWGQGFAERAPVSLLKVSQRLGGVVAGAFDDSGRMAGFVFGVTGLEDGEPVHWSDMLAVRPELRDSGLGSRLKRYQREQVLSLGIGKMYWTFDPLESKNAYLNFAKLGIVAREYVEDMYGHTDSPLHRGIGTDRFVALWLLDSERVRGRLDGGDEHPGSEELDDVPAVLDVARDSDQSEGPGEGEVGSPSERAHEGDSPGWPEPGAVRPAAAPRVTVAIPRDIQSLKTDDRELAARWRAGTREALTGLLAKGYEARELIPGDPVSRYLLVKDGTP